MAARHQQEMSSFRRGLRRFFLSAFVVVSFAAYALHKPSDNNALGLGTSKANAQSNIPGETPTQAAPTDPQAASQTDASGNQAQPTQAPATAPDPTATTALASGQYKNGTYTGQEIDAFYGLVQVQAVVQNGKISNVQFLQYPNDRRTSVRINNYAVPILQQEAVQVQNANVDLISGATLTSEAFSMSLQDALNQAKP